MKDYRFKVCIRCITYNHGPYIRDALNGFAMQQTDFLYVATIVDDASTDNNSAVIKDYLEDFFEIDYSANCYEKETDYGQIFFLRHKENRNCFFAVILLKENHTQTGKGHLKTIYISEWLNDSEYRITCEGDDFWCYPEKLQMQVDFLDNNPSYVMCHTDFDLAGGGGRNHYVKKIEDDIYFPYSVHNELSVGTSTALYRNDVFNRLPKHWIGKGWLMGDTPLWIEMSKEGKIKYMPVVTAKYRVLSTSASHGDMAKELKFAENAVEIHQFYAKLYNISLLKEGYSKGYYMTIMKIAFKHKANNVANACLKNAISNGCLSIKLLVLYFGMRFEPLRGFIRKKSGAL